MGERGRALRRATAARCRREGDVPLGRRARESASNADVERIVPPSRGFRRRIGEGTGGMDGRVPVSMVGIRYGPVAKSSVSETDESKPLHPRSRKAALLVESFDQWVLWNEENSSHARTWGGGAAAGILTYLLTMIKEKFPSITHDRSDFPFLLTRRLAGDLTPRAPPFGRPEPRESKQPNARERWG